MKIMSYELYGRQNVKTAVEYLSAFIISASTFYYTTSANVYIKVNHFKFIVMFMEQPNESLILQVVISIHLIFIRKDVLLPFRRTKCILMKRKKRYYLQKIVLLAIFCKLECYLRQIIQWIQVLSSMYLLQIAIF